MIVKAGQRADGDQLADHLLNVADGNEEVFVRPAPWAPQGATLHQAMALLEARAVGTRAQQPLVHASISPRETDPPMTEAEQEIAWRIYEEEHGLVGHDYIQVDHIKKREGSNIPSGHFHRVYTRVIPDNDPLAKPKCVTLRFPKITNELVQARICMELGRQMQPGPNIRTAHKWAVERGDKELADYIAAHIEKAPTPGGAPPLAATQSAKRNGRNAAQDYAEVYKVWAASEGDRKAFERGIAEIGLVVERGDKALILRARGTDLQYSLSRALAGGAKAAGVELRAKAATAAIAEIYRDAADVPRFVPGDRWRLASEAPQKAIIDHLLRKDSTFSLAQIEARIEKFEPPSPEAAEAMRDDLLADAVRLAGGRYTMRDRIDLERGMVETARALASDRISFLSSPLIEAAIGRQDAKLREAGFAIGDDQAEAARAAMGQGRLLVLEGYAGAGKSTTMAAVADGWRSGGGRIVGAAPSGKAAAGLAESIGDARTVAKLLADLHKGDLKLDDKTMLVVDEAGMIGSEDMAALLDAVQQARARVVLLGDTQQLQAVAAGGAMLAIKKAVDPQACVTLTSVVRQREVWMREASKAFNSQRTAEGLRAYDERGSIRIVGDPIERGAGDQAIVRARRDGALAARGALIADWQANLDRGGSSIILASTRDDVARLNEMARDIWRSRHSVDRGAVEVEVLIRAKDDLEDGDERIAAKRSFMTGDRVIFTKNDAKIGVKNSQTGTLTVGGDGEFFVQIDGAEHAVRFNPQEFKDYDYGWASTIHSAQGVTVDRAYALASRSMSAQLALVAATRHKSEFKMYASRADFRDFDALAKALSRQDLKGTSLDFDEEAAPEQPQAAPASVYETMTPAFIEQPAPQRDPELSARMRAHIEAAKETDLGRAIRSEFEQPEEVSVMRHRNSDAELEHFKRQDLSAYLRGQGYAPTKDGKWEKGEARYYVRREQSGEYKAWDNRANGNRPYSIVDIHIRDHGGNLGDARKALREQYPQAAELETAQTRAQKSAERDAKTTRESADKIAEQSRKSNEDLEQRARDQRAEHFRQLEAKRQAAQQLAAQKIGRRPVPRDGGHLQQRRGIPAHVQSWAGVSYDERGAAYLASMTRGEASPELTPSSYEKWWQQPDGSTARAQMKDGVKGHGQFGAQQPTRFVICESGIDAMSYATDDPQRETTRYISMGGNPSEYAKQHLADLAREHPDAAFVMAHDRDKAGHEQAQAMSEIVHVERERMGVEANVERHEPPERYFVGPDGKPAQAQDWNDNRRIEAGVLREVEPPRGPGGERGQGQQPAPAPEAQPTPEASQEPPQQPAEPSPSAEPEQPAEPESAPDYEQSHEPERDDGPGLDF